MSKTCCALCNKKFSNKLSADSFPNNMYALQIIRMANEKYYSFILKFTLKL